MVPHHPLVVRPLPALWLLPPSLPPSLSSSLPPSCLSLTSTCRCLREAEAQILICPLPPASQSPPSRCSRGVTLRFSPPVGKQNHAGSPCHPVYIHWYRYQEGSAPQRLLYFDVSGSFARRDLVLKADKVNAKKGRDGYSCNLSVLKLEKSDEGVYYCAAWEAHSPALGPGTRLIVTPPDKSPDEDISPKPTIFFPSIAEIKVQKAGTYLCLLEDFFPDVIKIDWKEKDGKTVLTSQQGDTVKTEDTYMKFSWLTLTEASLDKEHKCIVKHDKNKKGVDQEILFPSIDKGINKANEGTSVNAILQQISSPDTLQLQLTNTSAYYTYLLLLVKTLVYSAIIAICLLGRPALCGNGKSS
uniref:Ig-like domain-containing protein n=1 Tax=Ailuropoda melanoleuca TaxID=9646 RepID=G1L3Q0_AILME